MTDRADALARRLIKVLPDGDGNPGIDIAGTWFDWDGSHEEMQSVADEVAAELATALRAYAEEARREERQACEQALTGLLATGQRAGHVADSWDYAVRRGMVAIRARGEKR